MCLSRVRNCEQQKCKVLGDRKSSINTGKQLYCAKITVWCGIQASGVLDPYYLDNETVRGADYYELLNTYLRSSRPSFPRNYLFQQDGAPPHTINVVRPLLDSLLPDPWIGKHGPYNWSARSPDLSPPDFFLWGFVNDEVFRAPCAI